MCPPLGRAVACSAAGCQCTAGEGFGQVPPELNPVPAHPRPAALSHCPDAPGCSAAMGTGELWCIGPNFIMFASQEKQGHTSSQKR